MLMLLGLPAMILRLGFYALQGLADVLRGRKRLHAERTVLINAPRNAIWRFVTADRTVFDGWPAATELRREPVPGDGELYLSRIQIGGQEIARVAMRELERDEAAGTVRYIVARAMKTRARNLNYGNRARQGARAAMQNYPHALSQGLTGFA